MGVPKDQSLCRQAREYYYDLLAGRDAPVPQSVRDHVAHCLFCQGQVRQLGALLAETEPAGFPAVRMEQETVEALSRHFERIDEPVTCTHVKPFVPGLAAAVPLVRVSTPITVHVDQCPLCAQDVAALRALHLGGAQLQRLGWLYAQPPARDAVACRRARPAVAALGSLSSGGIDPRLANHVSTCPACRAAVYRQRERWRAADSGGTAGREMLPACNDILPADLFDLVVPAGAAPEAGRIEAVLAHLRTCRPCLERVQALHHTIYDMAERADSGISTIYNIGDATGDRSAEIAHACRYPTEAQPVLRREDSRAVSEAARKHGPVGPSRRSLARLALAAAAAVVLALLLPLHTPTASGTNVGEVLRSLENAPNVHIVTSRRPGTKPIQEMWIARPAQVLVLKTAGQCVLYDLKKRHKRALDLHSGLSAPIRLGNDEYTGSGRIMVDCVGGPLATLAQDTRVRRMPGDTPDGLDRQVVYELASEKQRAGGMILSYRWRLVVDPATGLPHRIEFFSRESPEGEWELKTIKTFEYLTEQGMQDEIKALAPAW